MIDGLCQLSSRDPLTGLANRRHFELTLASEVDRVARAGEPALVLMIDIDHFKRVNDAHGHQAGDIVLKAVAARARRMHPADGHGGALRRRRVLDDPAQLRAVRSPSTVAERIRTHVGSRSIAIGPGQEVSVTVSIGGAFAPQWVRSSSLLWVERADQQLYRAKSEGPQPRLPRAADRSRHVSAEEKGLLFGTSQFSEL